MMFSIKADKNNSNEEFTNLKTFIDESFNEMLLNKIKIEVAKVVDIKLNELIQCNGNVINPNVEEYTNDNLLNSVKSEISFLRKSLESKDIIIQTLLNETLQNIISLQGE